MSPEVKNLVPTRIHSSRMGAARSLTVSRIPRTHPHPPPCGFYMARMYSHAVLGKKTYRLCFQSSLRAESGISVGQSEANLGGPEQTLRTVFSKVLVYFLPPASSCGKVMFSQACHSFCPQEGDVCLWIQGVNKRAIRILLECFLVC